MRWTNEEGEEHGQKWRWVQITNLIKNTILSGLECFFFLPLILKFILLFHCQIGSIKFTDLNPKPPV